jgi:polyisoprenyl-teichoic acid--peptidoglycan teichoic acid transferase
VVDPLDVTVPGRRFPRRVTRRVAVTSIAIAACLVVSIVAVLLLVNQPRQVSVAAASTPSPTATPSPSAIPTPRPSPSPTPSAPAGPDRVLGTDGRLTILLLGSDYRPSHPGNRTDMIMVVSIDPASGAVAAASIPRDTSNFPTSSRRTYEPKINALYQSLIAQIGQPKAAREMKRIIGEGIGVEIDSYAVTGFEGVRKLVNGVGGVDVVLTKAVRDPYYWVTSSNRGVYFPAGRNHLNGDRALIFARTRKGDSDLERARRQQLLVAGAVDAVRKRGLENLPGLVVIANRFVTTDIPLASAPQLFDIVARARLDEASTVVFGTTKWATGGSGSPISLKLSVVRGWTAKWMAPVTASPTPAPRTTPLPIGHSG